MNKNEFYLTILCLVLLLIIIVLSWIYLPSFTISVISSIIASVLILIFIFLVNQIKKASESKTLKVWRNRDEVKPSISERIKSAKKNMLFVGLTLETTLNIYREYLKKALISQNILEIKLLMLHPSSPHVKTHQQFTDRNVQNNILEVVNNRLKTLYDELSPDAKEKLIVRATDYLPRFAVKNFDDEVMLINFYLYKRKAHANPVIEIRRDRNQQEFISILNSLNDLFENGKNIIHDGVWHGLPNEIRS